MKFEVFEAKTLEDAKAKALEELNVSEEEIISTHEEKKGKLFKGSTVLFKAVKISTVAEFIKENLKELLENMNIEAQFETNVRNSQINIKMYSDKNNILIGKNGQTLMAIQTILRQQVYNKINVYPHILLDVENYKEKKLSNLERRLDELKQENTYITVVANKVASVEELDNKVIGTVLFDINTANPAVEINNQLINVSALLDAFPSAKIQLEGYADEETGTPEYNQKLSEERTAYVQNLLTTKYNVPNDRIVTISYGSTKKAYTTSLAEQRVVVLRLVF